METKKKRNEVRYCSDWFFGKNDCRTCKKACICQMFEDLLAIGMPIKEAKEQCKRAEKIGITADQTKKGVDFYKKYFFKNNDRL